MANVEIKGFRVATANAQARKQPFSAAAQRGDALVRVAGKLLPYNAATEGHDEIVALAAEDVSAADVTAGRERFVYPVDGLMFIGQFNGVFDPDTHVGKTFGISGASGAMEIDPTATDTLMFKVLQHFVEDNSPDVGQDAKVIGYFAVADVPMPASTQVLAVDELEKRTSTGPGVQLLDALLEQNGNGIAVVTATGTVALTTQSAKYQKIDPNGAGRDVTLPPEVTGLSFFISNEADAAESLTVKDDAGSTIATIAQDKRAIVVCDGTTWEAITFAA